MNDKTPLKRLEFVITRKGEIRSIFSPEADQILRGIVEKHGGEIVTRRASHVEPTEELRDEALRWLRSSHPHFKRLPEASPAVLRQYGVATLPGHWWADLTPVGGPVLGPYATSDRDMALEHEIEWLKANNIPVCEPCVQNDPLPVRKVFGPPPETVLIETDGLGPIPMRITSAETLRGLADRVGYSEQFDPQFAKRAAARSDHYRRQVGSLDYGALERKLVADLAAAGHAVTVIDDCIIVDSATGIEPDPLKNISRLPQDVSLSRWGFVPPIQNIPPPLPPEKRKVRRAFLNGEKPVRERTKDKPPLRRTRQ